MTTPNNVCGLTNYSVNPYNEAGGFCEPEAGIDATLQDSRSSTSYALATPNPDFLKPANRNPSPAEYLAVPFLGAFGCAGSPGANPSRNDASIDAPATPTADASVDQGSSRDAGAARDASTDGGTDGPARPLVPIELISIGLGEAAANSSSYPRLAVSSDGRFVAFGSGASNLVVGDTNSVNDVFVYDRVARMMARVSVGVMGQANDFSAPMSDSITMSGDGQSVAFESYATNLVSYGDTNGSISDVFVRNRGAGTTELASVSTSGIQGNDWSSSPSTSSDGRFVAFVSNASNLVSDDTNGGFSDIFIHDRGRGTTELVSVSTSGAQENDRSTSPLISADGNLVFFNSTSTNLVGGGCRVFPLEGSSFVHDRMTGITECSGAGGTVEAASSDGRFIVFSSDASDLVTDDTNGVTDVFVFDREAGTTERVSVNSEGMQGNNYSIHPSVSADGRFVSFTSAADNLVDGDTNVTEDIFVHDRETSVTHRVSIATDGSQQLATSGASCNSAFASSISSDGRFAVFTSDAMNLVPLDTGGICNIFGVGLDYFFGPRTP